MRGVEGERNMENTDKWEGLVEGGREGHSASDVVFSAVVFSGCVFVGLVIILFRGLLGF